MEHPWVTMLPPMALGYNIDVMVITCNIEQKYNIIM